MSALFVLWLAVVWFSPASAGAAADGAPGARGRIAFMRDGDIWTVNADGSDARNLTNTPDDGEQYPTWSPDGTKIAFVRGLANVRYPQIWTMNAGGSNQRALTSGYDVYGADWSPDGGRIVYATNTGIETINAADGTGRTLVTGSVNASDSPRWSPDGQRIVFSSYNSGNLDINVINVDGSNRRRLTMHPDRDESPSWSPDGSRILFVSPAPCDNPCGYKIWSMDADGSNQAVLAASSSDYLWPVSSPDGLRIAFQGEVPATGDGYTALFTMKSDGSDITQISQPLFGFRSYSQLSWQSVPGDVLPSAVLSAPADGAVVQRGATVTASFQCSAAVGIASCVGTVAANAAIDTSSIGIKRFVVTATDTAGRTRRVVHPYSVVDQSTGSVSTGGGTVRANPDPSPSNPIGTSVAVPSGTAGGTVAITTSGAVTTPAPLWYSLLGYQIHIDAPTGTWSNPLILGFTIDPSAIPNSTDPESIGVTRDGTSLADCPDGATTATPPDDAHPDGQPCLLSHQVLANGDLLLTVATPHASDWNFAAPK